MGLVDFPSPAERKSASTPAAPRPPTSLPGRGARRAGTLILLAGLVAAALVYWIGTHRGERDIEDLIPNYAAANSRQMGLMYGHSGELMWEAIEAFKRPDVQAITIIGMCGLAAALCFRIAWLDVDHAEGESESHGQPHER